jgi:PEP-CTERM motif-containing protein
MKAASSKKGLAAIALGALLGTDARAVGFGPFPVVDPSSIHSEDDSIVLVPTGSVSIDIASVPHTTPQTFALTDVSITAGTLTFALDPTLASPALGVLQLDGTFLIPTLFLVGNDGTSDFDLAIPNLTGHLLGSPGSPNGLFTQFQVDSGHDVFDVSLTFAVPEPGTALLLSLGCVALACRRRKEIAR